MLQYLFMQNIISFSSTEHKKLEFCKVLQYTVLQNITTFSSTKCYKLSSTKCYTIHLCKTSHLNAKSGHTDCQTKVLYVCCFLNPI